MFPHMQATTSPKMKGKKSPVSSVISRTLICKSLNSMPDIGATKDGTVNRLMNKNTASTSLNSELRTSVESKSTSKEFWLTSLISGSSLLVVTNLAAYPRNGCPSASLPLPSAYSLNYTIRQM